MRDTLNACLDDYTAGRATLHGCMQAVWSHDMALVYLDHPVRGIAPLRLMDAASSRRYLVEGAIATQVGWGARDAGGGLEKRETTMTISNTGCEDTPYCKPGHDFVATHESGVQHCGGDSGGPLIIETASGPMIAGISSGPRGFRPGEVQGPHKCGGADVYFTRADSLLGWHEQPESDLVALPARAATPYSLADRQKQ
jgi:hypothetical protein